MKLIVTAKGEKDGIGKAGKTVAEEVVARLTVPYLVLHEYVYEDHTAETADVKAPAVNAAMKTKETASKKAGS